MRQSLSKGNLEAAKSVCLYLLTFPDLGLMGTGGLALLPPGSKSPVWLREAADSHGKERAGPPVLLPEVLLLETGADLPHKAIRVPNRMECCFSQSACWNFPLQLEKLISIIIFLRTWVMLALSLEKQQKNTSRNS